MMIQGIMEFLWNGGYTERFHTVPTLRVDTVGQHSFNVAVLMMTLRPDTPVEVLRAALKHDVAEHVLGDMPAPTKRMLPDYHTKLLAPTEDIVTLREAFGKLETDVAEQYGINLEQDMIEEDVWLLKLCDALDGFRFCVQERTMGNRHPKLTEAGENFKGYVAKLLYGEEPTHEILQFAKTEPLVRPQDIEIFEHLGRQWHAYR